MAVRVQIRAQLVTVSSFRNLFRHLDLHHIVPRDTSPYLKHSEPVSHLLNPCSVQVDQQGDCQASDNRPDSVTSETSQRDDCLDEIWELVSHSTDSDNGISGRFAPEQLNCFLTAISNILIKQDPTLKDAIEDFFSTTIRNNCTFIDRSQFKLILTDLENWFMGLKPHYITSGEQERKTFWENICDEIHSQIYDQQSTPIHRASNAFRKQHEQPRYIVVKRSALTRSGNFRQLAKRAAKVSLSRPATYLPPSCSESNLPQNRQLQFQIPLVSSQPGPDNLEMNTVEQTEEIDEVTFNKELENKEQKAAEPPCQSLIPPKPEKKLQQLRKVNAKARIECWNKPIRPTAKDEKNSDQITKPGTGSSLPGKAACNYVPSKKQLQRAARIQPTTDALRDCILFDDNDRIVTLHRTDAVLLDKSSRTNSVKQEAVTCKKVTAPRTSSININEHSLLPENIKPESKEISRFVKTEPYFPASSLRRRPSSSSSSWSTSRLTVFDLDGEFDSKEFDPLDETPEGWMLVPVPQNEEPKEGGEEQQQPQRRKQKQQLKQQQHHQQQQRDRESHVEMQRVERRQLQGESRIATGTPISEKTIWKMYRGRKPRCRIRRRIRLSGWELSELLQSIGQAQLLQVLESDPTTSGISKRTPGRPIVESLTRMRPGHVWSPWSELETKALLEAVSEYGLGQWATILRDATYGPVLSSRTNVDLKDKWRVLERARHRAGQPSLLHTYPNIPPTKTKAKKVPLSAVPALVEAAAGSAGPVAVIATAIDDEDSSRRQAGDNHAAAQTPNRSSNNDTPKSGSKRRSARTS